jgi:hypothetical protein
MFSRTIGGYTYPRLKTTVPERYVLTMHFEQCDSRLPDANSVLSDALVSALITLARVLDGKVASVHQTDPVTLENKALLTSQES